MQIILKENGTEEKNVDVDSIQIADLWYVAMYLEKQGPEFKRVAEQVLDVWHLAHDMRGALQSIAAAEVSKYIPSPVHTKPETVAVEQTVTEKNLETAMDEVEILRERLSQCTGAIEGMARTNGVKTISIRAREAMNDGNHALRNRLNLRSE